MTMKNGIIVLALVLGAFMANSFSKKKVVDEGKGIAFFEGSWDDALSKAKKENKLIFLDAYASWCGPCKRLKANVFPQEQVGKVFNQKFINVKMDMEKGEGPVIAEKYNVTAYPTLLFINGDGKVVRKALGYHKAEELIELANGAK